MSYDEEPVKSDRSEKKKNKNKLRSVRIEPANGGFVVQVETNDWENRPDPTVFTDEDKMYDYLSECFAKHEVGTLGKVDAKAEKEEAEED